MTPLRPLRRWKKRNADLQAHGVPRAATLCDLRDQLSPQPTMREKGAVEWECLDGRTLLETKYFLFYVSAPLHRGNYCAFYYTLVFVNFS